MEILRETQSLCPVCLERIPAYRVVEGDNVYLQKACHHHGEFRALIWRGAELYKRWGERGVEMGSPQVRYTTAERGCPYDCGLCPGHLAETCVAIMEVTHRCNLDCPVCFASASEGGDRDHDFDVVRQMYRTIKESARKDCPVQLSGGEPTLRDDLPEIVAMGNGMGFEHIQVNTNGIRIAEDLDFLSRLKQAGVSLIYLQFDGVDDGAYLKVRGRALLATKLKAVENCAALELGVILVPTLVSGVNLGQVGSIVRFAKSWIPVVKGIHFQPIAYLGRYPASGDDSDRVITSDVLNAIEEQTGGELKAVNFAPRRRRESHCAFGGFFVLSEEGRLEAMTSFQRSLEDDESKGEPYRQARRFISRRWRFVSGDPRGDGARPGSWESFFKRARTHYLSITGMPFQDVWSIDMERLRRCCTHVVTADGRLVPLCAYYCTDVSGRRLVEARGSRRVS